MEIAIRVPSSSHLSFDEIGLASADDQGSLKVRYADIDRTQIGALP